MSKLLKYILIFLFGGMLLTSMAINFYFDKEFLNHYGFEPFIIIALIVVFITAKVTTEFLFFRLMDYRKWILGVLSLLIIAMSTFAMFTVRSHKASLEKLESDKTNMALNMKSNESQEKKNLILSQINELNNQIELKKSMIKELDPHNDKWLRLKYSKDITALNKSKMALLNKYESFKTDTHNITKKQTSFTDTQKAIFGSSSQGILTTVDLILSILVEIIFLLFTFALSYVLKIDTTINKIEKQESRKELVIVKNENSVSIPSKNIEYTERLRKAVNESNLTVDQFAKEKLGISKMAMYKILNGVTKKPSSQVMERIEAVI